MVIALNHLLIELSFYAALAFCLNTEAVTARYLRAKTRIDLGALGVRILLSRRRPAPRQRHRLANNPRDGLERSYLSLRRSASRCACT